MENVFRSLIKMNHFGRVFDEEDNQKRYLVNGLRNTCYGRCCL